MNPIFDDKKIRKRYNWDDSNVDFIRFPNELLDDFLMDAGKFVDIPINALRVIFNIIFIVRNDQFRPEDRPRQLSLFEEEFETENNVFVQLSIKNARISPSGSTLQVIKAYEFLTKFKMEWHKALNSKGEEIKTFGGLISNPSYNKRGETTFLISRYWLRKIVVISEYNPLLYNLVYNVKNNKHILFALWLKKVPFQGTSILLTTFNKKFDLNYANSGDFCTKFLSEVRKSLNQYSDLSFNYKYSRQLIFILPYLTKKIDDLSISEETTVLIRIKQRLRYFKSRFEIEDHHFLKFENEYYKFPFHRELIEKAYRELKISCRKKRLAVTIYKGKMFLEEMQRILIEFYQVSESGRKFPNGFPVIV